LEASENIAAISAEENNFPVIEKHKATAVLGIKNTQNKDVEEEEGEAKIHKTKMWRKRKEKQQQANRIFQRKFIHVNRPFIATVK
jgi:hypothetical protein